MEKFWNWVDSRSVIRRIVLFVTLYMTWASFAWAASFAEESTKPGMEIAAIIAAVVAPVAALQGFVFNTYAQGRNK